MKLHPRLSRAAVELVTRFETFQPEARPATPAGWTIGYGHTRSAREGATVSRTDAEALLLFDLSVAAATVAAALYAPANPRQFEALTAFAFNIGTENFRRSSALARFNAGRALEAADEIERWRTAELGGGAQVVDALVRRRAAEKAHFLGVPEGFAKSPSAVLRPLPTHAAARPAAPAPSADSALRQAADGIQARLRALVPEPEAVAGTEIGPEAPPFPDAAPPAEDVTAPELAAPGIAASGLPPREPPPPAPPAPYAPPLSPPPAPLEPAPANDALAEEPPVPPPPPLPASPRPSAEPIAQAAPAPAPPAASPQAIVDPNRRTLYVLLAAVGAALFVAAVVLILGGKPTLPSLLLGVVGALVLTPGVYGLLGPRRAG